jgi:hypothetical protein
VKASAAMPLLTSPSTRPIVPVLSGERPLVQDPFNLRRFVAEGTPAGRDLTRRIARREFSAVILRENEGPARDIAPGDPALRVFRDRYWREHGDPLLDLFHTAYEIQAVRRPFIILLPRR